MPVNSFDKLSIYRHAAILVSVCLILIGCLIVLEPSLPALLLAIIFCVSTWPAFRWLQRRLDNRVSIAAFVMTVLLAAFFVLPLVVLGSSMVENFHSLIRYFYETASTGPRQLPEWIGGLPVVGSHIEQSWENFTADRARMQETIRQFAKPVSEWLLVLGTGIGRGVVQVGFGVFISFFLFQNGATLVSRIRRASERLGGKGSLRFLAVTESTMMSLVYGILGTALVLGILSTVAFFITGVPGAPFLGLLTFLLGILPGGPPLVLFPVTLWLFYMGSIGKGIFMGLWAMGSMGLIDLAIRPYLISMGSKMPMILILLGVFGGVIAFGFIGLFIGPALLSVAYAMFNEWSNEEGMERIAND
jgi:predicted PurR-regulated permease PerM